ncbi:MAG: Efflux ABC transporter, ATP-binding protein [uncultured Nocardioidaceae bacterium]|uniref:Efflux ABC transporter, ATP-binding protein n=1 Tax=uncultured Nocardioidaceae bacterium TaxID=253824 RepID=A0A6J4LJF8_9ACTN|nr:MAG: Efflux ABC transporter, ATP-binding protein [uncultured Nocardioidaceae bacterium]
MGAEEAVLVSDLVVERGSRRVLHGVSMRVSAGGVTGVLGPSGGGKTTLLRAIVGVQRIQSGTVQVLGLPAGTAALRSRVSYVTQAPSVYTDLTVRQNATYFAAVLGISSRAADEAIDAVGLHTARDQLVGTLSGGQRNRASLACALLGRPEVLVLDEPTVGLDPVLREELWGLFHTIAVQGTAVLVTSHVMDEAARCDRLLLLREGVVVADDTPDGLRRRTDTPDLDQAFLRLVQQLSDQEVSA